MSKNPCDEVRRLLSAGRCEGVEQILSTRFVELVAQGGAETDLAEVQMLRAACALAEKQPARALERAFAAVALAPGVADVQLTLGRALRAADRPAEAAVAFEQAVALEPRSAQAHIWLGLALKDLGRLDEAIARFRAAIDLQPTLAAAHANLGNALAVQARQLAHEREATGAAKADEAGQDDAEEAHRRAVALEPHNPAAHRNLGVSLMVQGRYPEAAECFNQALGLDVSDRDACIHLGHCLARLGADDTAQRVYETWLQRNEPSPEVLCALSASLNEVGESTRALDCAQQAFALSPDAFSLQRIAGALLQSRRQAEAIEHFRRSLEEVDRWVGFYSPLLMAQLYVEPTQQAINGLAADYGRTVGDVPRPPPRQRAAGAPLRIGYVSGDLRRHSVSYFVEPLLQHHDRSRFEVSCYHSGRHRDDVTARLRGLGHHWLECGELTEAQLEQRLRDDALDILIDLSGHTARNRLMVFARRPAPLQVGYLGYPTVTGLPALDFRITDPVIDAPDEPASAVAGERPLRLPHSMFCYRPELSPETGEPPVLERGVVTFGSFNNLAKLSDDTLRLWAAVLRAVPRSRLLLKTRALSQPANQAAVRAFFAAQDVDPCRLDFSAWAPEPGQHLTLYRQIDIALDSVPYNGATTSCETLWMGVPLVTLQGQAHHARVGASLLRAIGKAPWIASTPARYVALAAALAADLDGLRDWRRQARDHMRASPLMDEAGFTRAFEHTLLEAWQTVAGTGSGAPVERRPVPAEATGAA